MNEYVLYEQLLAMEGIAGQYPAGNDCARQIRETVERIRTRLYRVAVIGEFKRGKSSLINAIIGAEVLPTDVLPMTAAVTRVTYGDHRRILIRYKDGSSEERTVEELLDFATKYDAEKEKTAATIREIEVTHPSVFCKNHIDILDTPGLNDNESMTEVTLGVLGEVDAAIMVISAKAPLSLTEQNLILNMISQPQIRHIIFVVTHIDAVSNRKQQQDKLIAFIQDRLSGELLEKARNMFKEKPRFLRKAEQILEKPDIFGVSSVLAIDGFIHDDAELLEQSRFPYFKKELLALLTAAQSGDVEARTREAAHQLRENLDSWYHAARNAAVAECMLWGGKRDCCQKYYDRSHNQVIGLLRKMDARLTEAGIWPDRLTIPEFENLMRREFIKNLSQIRADTNTNEHIRNALLQGGKAALAASEEEQENLECFIRELMGDVLTEFAQLRQGCGFPMEALREQLRQWSETSFPSLKWTVSLIPSVDSLPGYNVMAHVQYAVNMALRAWAVEIGNFIASWRILLLRQNRQDLENREPLRQAEAELAQYAMRRNLLEAGLEPNREKLEKIMEALHMAEGIDPPQGSGAE